MDTVITGASRGIGLEFVRQLSARGDRVYATARDVEAAQALNALAEASSGRVTVSPLDVTDPNSVKVFAAALGGAPVDLLINNAGVGGGSAAFEALDHEKVKRVFEVNAVGPMRVTAALLPNLRASRAPVKKVAFLSSLMGSMADNRSGGSYPYRMSKAALNMAVCSFARDFEGEQVAAVALHPGWVKTDMGGRGAPLEVEPSVEGLLRVLDGLRLEASGRFLDYQGNSLPW